MSNNHCKKCNKPLVEHEKKLCGSCRLKRNEKIINGMKCVVGVVGSVVLIASRKKK